MCKHIARFDAFNRNIVLVFIGTTAANLLNLFYQLLIAHRLSPEDFAGFNALLSVYMMLTMPLGTLQPAIAKYSAEYNARNQPEKTRFLLSFLFKKGALLALATGFLFYLPSLFLAEQLKITAPAAGGILTLLIALTWVTPVFAGALQGLELFGWVVISALIPGILKLCLTFVFLHSGFKVSGALSALLLATLLGLVIGIYALRKKFSFNAPRAEINWKEFFIFLLPVAVTFFCFSNLVSIDMVMVKYFFSPQESGAYSLAQMLGKIFLFLPGAISLVMFPRTSGLNAAKLDTLSTLKRSLFYAALLSAAVSLGYNLFPELVLTILTGKALPEAVFLGRLFSVSMVFFTLSYVLVMYFLSIRDFRFLKFMIAAVILQFLGVLCFHHTLAQVQGVLCVNAILLFSLNLKLVFRVPLKVSAR